MIINGVDSKYRDGDCLQQSIAFLLSMSPSHVPRFHKLPLSTWKQAFETWISAQKKSLSVINEEQYQSGTKKPFSNSHIAVVRAWHKIRDEKLTLHAIVVDNEDNVLFDTLDGKNDNIEYRYIARRYFIQ